MILIFILGLVALRILYSVGEIYYERDWPRSTWKGLLIALGVLCIAVSAFGQAARMDIPLQTAGPSVPISGGPLPQALWVANAAAYLCTHPSSTLAACQAAPITTYTDSTEGTTCPSTEQMVQLPGNTCTASSGVTANVGFWYGGGVFDYWIVSSYGTYGPFSGYSSNFPSSCGNPIGIPCGGTGATTAAGALANLGAVPLAGGARTGADTYSTPAVAQNQQANLANGAGVSPVAIPGIVNDVCPTDFTKVIATPGGACMAGTSTQASNVTAIQTYLNLNGSYILPTTNQGYGGYVGINAPVNLCANTTFTGYTHLYGGGTFLYTSKKGAAGTSALVQFSTTADGVDCIASSGLSGQIGVHKLAILTATTSTGTGINIAGPSSNNGDGVVIERPYVAGYEQPINVQGWSKVDIIRPFTLATAASGSTYNIVIKGLGDNSGSVIEPDGACATSAAGPATSLGMVNIQQGMGWYVRGGDQAYCPIPLAVGVPGGSAYAQVNYEAEDSEEATGTIPVYASSSLRMIHAGYETPYQNTTGPFMALNGNSSADVDFLNSGSGWSPAVATNAPTIGTITTATGSGSNLDNTTYYYKINSLNSIGQTILSGENTVTTGNSGVNQNTITIPWTPVLGETGVNICKSLSTGTEQLLSTSPVYNSSSHTFTDTGSGSLGATCSNTATFKYPVFTMSNTSDAGKISSAQPRSSYLGPQVLASTESGEYYNAINAPIILGSATPVANAYTRGAFEFYPAKTSANTTDVAIFCGRTNAATFGCTGNLFNALFGNSSNQFPDSSVYDGGGVSTSPVCPNATGGTLTTSGCTGAGATPAPYSGLVEQCDVVATYPYMGGCALTLVTTTIGTPIGAESSMPIQVRLTSGGTSGTSAGMTDSVTSVYLNKQPTLKFGSSFLTSTDYSSSALINFGYLGSSCSVATFTASYNPACSYAVIQFSTVRGDTYYQCVTGNGSSQTVTPIGTTTPANGGSGVYQTMSVAIYASNVVCTVGTTSVMVTTTLPASSVMASEVFLNTTLQNVATHLQLSAPYAVYQNGSQ